MLCPKCSKELQMSTPVLGYLFRNAFCINCDRVMIIDTKTGLEVIAEDLNVGVDCKIKVDLPIYDEGTLVYVNNRESLLFLELGKVVSRNHKHCRVKFVSNEPKFNGFSIWIPDHWLRPLPDFFCR